MRNIAILTMALIITGALTLGSSQSAFAVILIDTFDDTTGDTTDPPTTGVCQWVDVQGASGTLGPNTDSPVGSAIEGERRCDLENTAANAAGTNNVDADIDVANNNMLHADHAGVGAMKLHFKYGFTTDLELDFDPLGGPATAGIRIFDSLVEAPGLPTTIVLTDSIGNTATCVKSLNTNELPATPFAFTDFPLGCFVKDQATDLDITDIDMIDVTFESFPGKNFLIESIETYDVQVVGGQGGSMNPIALLLANMNLSSLVILPAIVVPAVAIGLFTIKRSKKA